MATLDDIVSAAAKVFRTKGYHAATVRDLSLIHISEPTRRS